MPRKPSKPAKPYKDFPLFPHANGQWAKKIRGRLHYFGTWDDWKGAVELYQRQRDDLHAGRSPTPGEGLELWQLADAFLAAKHSLVESEELTQASYRDYEETCRAVLRCFGAQRVVAGLQAADFDQLRGELAKRLGPVTLGNEINRVRIVFRYGWEAGLLDRPVRFGPHFKRPSAKAIRLHRAEVGPRLFSAEQLLALLGAAKPQLRAMILLGVNAGLGNADVGRLAWGKVGADGWLAYPRPKTGVDRRAWLWPETMEALPARGEPSDPVFLTKYGSPWHDDEGSGSPLTSEFRKLLDELGLYRRGLGFYTLRHTFATVAGESKDQVAVDHVMGHAPASSDMRAVYRESISDQRLRDVCEFVRCWLFPET